MNKHKLTSAAMSLVEIVIGILLLIDPLGFTSGIIIAFGFMLMLAGVITVINYFRTDAEKAAVSQSLIKGLLLLLAGFCCAFKSHWLIVTLPFITIFYGAAILISGVTKIQWAIDAIRLKEGKWLLTIISALISIICGIMVIANPFSSTAVMWIFVGVSLIVDAVFDMIGSIVGSRK